MKKILTFVEKMSGITIQFDDSEKVENVGMSIEYDKIAPELRHIFWWTIPYVSIEFIEKGDCLMLRNKLNPKERFEGYVGSEVKKSSLILLSSDDSVTIWVYMNRQDIWQELLEKFGNEDKIWSTYLRWRH